MDLGRKISAFKISAINKQIRLFPHEFLYKVFSSFYAEFTETFENYSVWRILNQGKAELIWTWSKTKWKTTNYFIKYFIHTSCGQAVDNIIHFWREGSERMPFPCLDLSWGKKKLALLNTENFHSSTTLNFCLSLQQESESQVCLVTPMIFFFFLSVPWLPNKSSPTSYISGSSLNNSLTWKVREAVF